LRYGVAGQAAARRVAKRDDKLSSYDFAAVFRAPI
jgi:hypothetical protein